MQGVGICVATGVGAAVVGWWFRASGLARRWVEDARAVSPHLDGQTGPASRASPVAVWPGFTGAAGAAVAAALFFGRLGPLGMVPFLGVWACGVALLALVDRETLLLPRKLVHVCGWAVLGLLVANSAATGDWNYIKRSLLCALAAGAAFGMWVLLRPRNLGLGDVRMACLVALGAGALSPAACVVALACAPFLAACISALRWRRRSEERNKPIALGPFFALAGIVAVVARAV
jgi:leader peptidase (prepilin peptidase) / N-methyltransferase